MCHLDRINGKFACSSNALQNKIVKQLYGYRGCELQPEFSLLAVLMSDL